MRRTISIIGGILLAASMSSPGIALAKHKGGGSGGESQAGGLPALEDRVDALQTQVDTLTTEVGTLTTEVTDLQGQNNWAVVSSSGSLVRSSGTVGSVTAAHVGTGQYEVTFSKDVSGCVYEATIGDTATAVPAQGQISVSGDTDTDNPNDVFVQTFDKTGGTATDSPFHLYVSCP